MKKIELGKYRGWMGKKRW